MLYSVSMDFDQMSGFRHKIEQKNKAFFREIREKALKTVSNNIENQTNDGTKRGCIRRL